MSYRPRTCQKAPRGAAAAPAQTEWEMSTGQSLKSQPAQRHQAQAAIKNAAQASGDVFCAVRWALPVWIIGVLLWWLS